MLQVQVGEVSMLEALNDAILSQQAKVVIQQEYAACDAQTGQAQVNCFIRAGERVQQQLEEEYRSRRFWIAELQRLWGRVQQIS
ncbi:hypothetical protein IQ273_08355 [Nodosilinea sp. LEGE 07298]|uniref:hypothetical protein n=1 Tax=Nodosilinea sp. LEGE 07298 TaxID=2777970 RepID=UPI00187E4455|nr:hypothetical protein [Nodosilinea sp. LEGE 07298]MBE9109426.1 hypothetical protein [Nodosilinea sp. LEGE 07298]